MIAALKAPVIAAYMLAAFGGCKASAPPAFDLQFEVRAPTYFRDSTSTELEQMKGESAGHGRIGGLTRNETRSALNITTAEMPQVFDDDYCLWPTDVKVRIELHPTVWVASQYAQGSCRYNVAYVHEMLHVKIARDTLSEFMPGIEALLRAKVATLGMVGPIPESAIESAKNRQMAEIQSALDAAIKRVDMVLEGRQAVIDTPQAYLQASNACPAEGEWGRR